MDTIEGKVDETMTTVIRGYYRLTKSTHTAQQQIDKALDEILEFSQSLEKRTKEIVIINELIQKLTWIASDAAQIDMEAIEIIIDSCNKLITDHLNKEKQALEKSSLVNHLPTVINSFLEEVENLEENIQDLNEIFFVIPASKEFQRINELLSDC